MASPEAEKAVVGVLPVGEIHVWRVRLVPPSEPWSLLSHDESARANGFRSVHDRHRFVAARSTLRQILGSYVGIRPEHLQFEYGPNGKPSLLGSSLRFNVSHAADMALYAVCVGTEVGVDLEMSSVLLDPESVVRRCMTKRERRLLDRVDPESRDDAVLTTWVRKEAVAKGRGEGLGLDLALIHTRPDLPAEATAVKVGTSPRDKWFVCDVPVGTGGAGAVATQEKGFQVRYLSTSSLLPKVGAAASLAP